MTELHQRGDSGSPDAEHEIEAFYDLGREQQRLHKNGMPNLELVRILELLERLLPAPPAKIIDVGGGPGTYALALSERGYAVKVIDASPRHVDEACARALDAGDAFTAELGDARHLHEPDGSYDAALLLGPLYHMISGADRLRALREAARVLHPNGVVLALGIPRFHSFLDGIRRSVLAHAQFNEIAWEGYRTGVHRNPLPEQHPEWFTTAYFHYPNELAGEMGQAGFEIEATYSVLAAGFLTELRWHELSDEEQDATLEAIRALEREESLLGLSDFLVVGRKN